MGEEPKIFARKYFSARPRAQMLLYFCRLNFQRKEVANGSEEVGLEEDHEERREEGREEAQVTRRHGEKSQNATGRPGRTPGRPALRHYNLQRMTGHPPPSRRPIFSNLSPVARGALWVWACTFILAVALLASFLVREFLARRSVSAWPATTGTLLQAEAVGVFSGGSAKYRIDVAYTYEVNGRSYRGDRLTPGDGSFRDLRSAQSALRGLDSGRPVTVYYDPADPTRSVLRPPSPARQVLLLALPLLMAAAGGVLLYLLRKSRPPQPAAGAAASMEKPGVLP
jgi:hypothetical protein